MADDTLPIVFRTKPSTAFVALGFGVLAVVGGIAKITDHSYAYSMEHFGPFEIDPQTSGWLMVAIGAALAFYALVTIVRRCPTLTLDQTGILLNRCLQHPVEVPWNRVADVIVRSATIPGRWRSTVVDMVYVMTDDGKETGVGNLGQADAVADAIRRVAARMNSPLRETA